MKLRQDRLTRPERATTIAAAIGRFEAGTTTGDHDGRLVAENLGIEAAFGGSLASRRQQIQHYFKDFPDLKRRWAKALEGAKEAAPKGTRDLLAELAEVRAENARLQIQVDTLTRVADLQRRRAEQLERRVLHPGAMTPPPEEDGPTNVISLPRPRR